MTSQPLVSTTTAKYQQEQQQQRIDQDSALLKVYRVTEADSFAIRKFLISDFLVNEPLNGSINLSQEDSAVLFESVIKASIESPLSCLIRDHDHNVIGVRLCSPLTRPGEQDTMKNELDAAKEREAPLSEKAMLIKDLLAELESKIWILTEASVNKLISLNIISVDRNYGRLGLAGKLVNYGLDEYREMGYQGIIAEATAFKSQRLFKKHGFETIYQISHDQWLDKSGKPIFQCKDGTVSADLMIRRL